MVKKIYKYVSNDGMEHDTRAACEQRDAELELAGWFRNTLAGVEMDLDAAAQLAVDDATVLLALLKRIVPPTPRQRRQPAAPSPLLSDHPPVGDASGGGAESAPAEKAARGRKAARDFDKSAIGGGA